MRRSELMRAALSGVSMGSAVGSLVMGCGAPTGSGDAGDLQRHLAPSAERTPEAGAASGQTAPSGLPSGVVGECGTASTPIAALQGAGDVSPHEGELFAVEGVVVADYQDSLDGFFVQDPEGDGDPATSEGLFVFQGRDDTPVALGDRVRVRGTVAEYAGLTELTDVTDVRVCSAGHQVAATPLSLPLTQDVDLERHEGMRVQFAQTLSVTDTYDLARFGEVSLSAEGRLFIASNAPFRDAAALMQAQQRNEARRILLDDARSGQNQQPLAYVGEGGTLRLGDEVSGLEAVVSQGFGSYRLQPLGSPRFERAKPRQAAPADVGGNLKVGSFNVLNYFTTLNERGASCDAELQRQAAKLVAALSAMDADIVALAELENGVVAAQDLVARLNAALGAEVYASLDVDTLGHDILRVGLLYKPAVVQPVGEPSVISFDGLADPAHVLPDRPSLAQRFACRGRNITVVANHFKSKGCGGASEANRDAGQGCWNARREASAQAVLAALDAVASATGDSDALVLGDLNAYAYEDPVQALEQGGLVNLLERFVEPSDRYTYVYAGQSGVLDHALASPSLAAAVTGVDIWHINADEPRWLDYNTEFNPPAAYAADPFRSSDHDPVLVGLQL